MNEYLKRTWAEINLDNLNYNLNQIKNKLDANTKVMAVVKADGYGHGDRFVANELVAGGVDFLAVSSLAEALSLRNAGIACDILILGFTPADKASVLAELGITQTIFSDEYAAELSRCATVAGCEVCTHIKLDTGMGRIGFESSTDNKNIDKIAHLFTLEGISVKGVFSHLSSADTLDKDSIAFTKEQIERFDNVVAELRKCDLPQFVTHLQNSAGIAFSDGLRYDYARAGIVLFGCPPSLETPTFSMKPVMSLKSVISMVKTAEAGRAISYGRTFVTEKPTKIATIPIGYADGYPRLLSNKGYMLVHGQKAPIIGNVCMDQLMIDVSGIDNVKQDDIVTVVGNDGDASISFWELATSIGTIGYELMCLIGKRVPRVYYKGGKRIAVVDYTQSF